MRSHRSENGIRLIFSILTATAIWVALVAPASARLSCGPPVTYSVFEQDGWGSDWSHVLNTVAFNRKGVDGYYHIYFVKADGSNERVFGEQAPNFPPKTVGSPVFSPDGQYVAFVAEKPSHPGGSDAATPGWGGYSDLWIASTDGSRVWQLTNMPNDRDHGTLLPQFSPNGNSIAWTERTKAPNIFNPNQTAGYWVIKVADFLETPDGPQLANVRTYSPGGDHFNETGGFSADSKRLVITSDAGSNNFWLSEIYKLDLASGQATVLADGGYNEHPRYTPDGRIIWMSSVNECWLGCGTDWWLMNADGSGKIRLTYFNDKTNANYFGQQIWPTVVQTDNWSADGSFFLGTVNTNIITNAGEILKVNLSCR